jgi:hypothetical protein
VNLTLGEVKLTIAGKNKTLQMSVFTSAKGDYRSGNLYHNQKTEAFLDTHASFFEEIGGVYKEMVYDNTRVMVARFVGRSEKEPTDALWSTPPPTRHIYRKMELTPTNFDLFILFYKYFIQYSTLYL